MRLFPALLGVLLLGVGPDAVAAPDVSSGASTAAAPAASVAAPAVLRSAPKGHRPADRLAWAEQLVLVGEAGLDLAVAVLSTLLGDPVVGAEAARRLDALLLSLPPRSAWTEIMKAARDRPGNPDPMPMRLHLDRAWLRVDRSRPWAVSDAQGITQAPGASAAVKAQAWTLLAEAALYDGALPVAKAALVQAKALAAERVPVELEVAILIREGQPTFARAIAGSSAPPTCRQPDEFVDCADWLVALGRPEVALRSLDESLGRVAASSDKVPLLLRAASLAESLGQPVQAARLFEQASDIRPADLDLRRKTGLALLRADQEERAGTYLSADDPALRAGGPARQRARVHAAIDAGRMNEALQDIELQVAERPEDTEAIQLLIGLASTTRQPGRAIEPLLHALPKEDAPWERRALQHWLASRLAEHGQALRETGELGLGSDALLQAIALDPTALPSWVAAGGALWADRHPDAAREAFSVALSLDPGHAEALSALVRLLASLDRWDEAHAVVSSQKKVDPGLVDRLSLLEETARIRALWREGDRGEAEARTAALERRAPDDAAVLHALGDLFLEQRMEEAAVRAYTRSIAAGDDGGWSSLGLANTHLLRGETADLDAADALLDGLAGQHDPVLRREVTAARGRILGQRANLARERGEDLEAFELIARALEVSPDTWALGNLGGLYLDHWQFEAAEAMYQGAVDLDGRNVDAWAGLAVARMGRGDFDGAAQVIAAKDLAGRSVAPGRTFGEELAERRTLAAVQQALRESDVVGARALLTPLLEAQPTRPAPWLTLADCHMAAKNHPAALIAVQEALRLAPVEEGVLGAALTVGYATGQLPAVLPSLRAALGSGAPMGEWVAPALRSAELHLELEAAKARMQAGDRAGARKAVANVSRQLQAPTALDQLALGAAWSEVGRPRAAAVAFRAALADKEEGSDVTRIIGEAGAYRALGRPGAAARRLEAAWTETKDPRLGAELARVEVAMGHPLAASRALVQVEADPTVPEVLRLRRLPDPMPILDVKAVEPVDERLHPGPRLVIRRLGPDDAAHVPAAPVGVVVGLEEAPGKSPPVDVRALRAEVGVEPRWVVTASGLVGGRPETLGVGGLRLVGADVNAEWVAADPLRLRLEALPLAVSDDLGGDAGVSLALDAASPTEGPLAWRAVVGSSPLGMASPATVVGYGELRWRARHLWELALSGSRAPVIDSWFSLAGDPAEDAGRVTDNWIDLRAGLRGQSGLTLGGVGRAGALQGLSLDPTPWVGGVFWLRVPFQVRELPVELGLDGLHTRHSDWVGGAWAGEAGVYTPAAFTSARARATLGWNPRELAFCAAGGVGPQWSRERDWEPEPAVGLGWDAAASATWRPEGAWWLGALGRVDAGATGWGSVLGLATVGYGHLSRGDVPGPTSSAVAHGLVLREAGPCPLGGTP
jgi:tetratricopeptide (TPR) repeat protein